MNPFRLTPEADKDIGELLDYIHARSGINAALRVADELDSGMASVGRRPSLGHRREDLTSRDVWFYRVYSYLIVYRKSSPVAIIRVLHGNRDVAAELTEEDATG